MRTQVQDYNNHVFCKWCLVRSFSGPFTEPNYAFADHPYANGLVLRPLAIYSTENSAQYERSIHVSAIRQLSRTALIARV